MYIYVYVCMCVCLLCMCTIYLVEGVYCTTLGCMEGSHGGGGAAGEEWGQAGHTGQGKWEL